jgi:hypothetical protein
MQDEISRMPVDDEERAEKGILSLLLASDSQRLGRLRSLNVSVASTSGPSMQSQACTLRA